MSEQQVSFVKMECTEIEDASCTLYRMFQLKPAPCMAKSRKDFVSFSSWDIKFVSDLEELQLIDVQQACMANKF
jgi:hypothetical protein